MDNFGRKQTVTPERGIIDCFARRTDSIFEQANTLQHGIRNLRRTRHLLLPRLLSGQVELVSVSANGASSNQPQRS